jgi:hypothetical protein
MARPVEDLSDEELRNVVENHRRHNQIKAPLYLDALAELARRKGFGLDFQKSFDLIRKAAAEGRFLSYKQLADKSGADWAKVHYAINGHLWDLISYAHGKGWPMLSAVVVNQRNVESGEMEPSTLKGFVEAARLLGHPVTDKEAFLKEQQQAVFAWATRKSI